MFLLISFLTSVVAVRESSSSLSLWCGTAVIVGMAVYTIFRCEDSLAPDGNDGRLDVKQA